MRTFLLAVVLLTAVVRGQQAANIAVDVKTGALVLSVADEAQKITVSAMNGKVRLPSHTTQQIIIYARASFAPSLIPGQTSSLAIVFDTASQSRPLRK